jgi:hypothetical protein
MPLTNAEVNALLGRVNIIMANPADGRLNPMMLYAAATRDAVNAAAAEAVAVVTARAATASDFQAAKRLFELMNANAGASAGAVLANVHLVMIGLGASWDHAANAPTAATTALRANVWPTLTGAERTTLGRFVKGRAALSAMTALTDLAAVAPATPLVNLRTLAQICDAAVASRPGDADPVRLAGITVAAFPALRSLHGTNAPNSHFGGFAAWGPGDHGAAAANVEGHFRKHVCGLVAPGGVLLEYRAEFAEWWSVLAMSLSLPEVTARLAGGQNTNDVADYFYDTNQTLAMGYLDTFISSNFLQHNPAVVAHLRARFEAAYEAYAIAASGTLDEVLVQSNGLLVFISGCKAIGGRDLFVIGRLDAGVLGISSAYFTREREAKMRGARSNKLWDLT